MDEWELIERIKEKIPNSQIGDDCALLGKKYLLSKDLLVEGTHFLIELNPPQSIAKRAVTANISDIIASGGKPLYALVGIGLKKGYKKTPLLIDLIVEELKRYDVTLVGGDTVVSNNIIISVTIIGKVLRHVKRDGAKDGDLIFVSGKLGLSKVGYLKLKKGIKSGRAVNKFLYPEPRYDLMESISKIKINSMIDISDGFLIDLKHVLKESNKGAVVELENFLLDDEIKSYFGSDLDKIYNAILSSGEEYELIVTAPLGERKKLLKLGFYVVGEINSSKAIEILYSGKPFKPDDEGYTHEI